MSHSLLLLAAWSSFPLASSSQHPPLSGVVHGAIYGGKAWQMQDPSAKSLDAFYHQCCQQWHLVALLASCSALMGGGPDSGPGQHSAEMPQVWWVGPFL